MKRSTVLGAYYPTSLVGATDNLKRDFGFASLATVIAKAGTGTENAAIAEIKRTPGAYKVITKDSRVVEEDGVHYEYLTLAVVLNEGAHKMAPSIRKSGDIEFCIELAPEEAQA